MSDIKIIKSIDRNSLTIIKKKYKTSYFYSDTHKAFIRSIINRINNSMERKRTQRVAIDLDKLLRFIVKLSRIGNTNFSSGTLNMVNLYLLVYEDFNIEDLLEKVKKYAEKIPEKTKNKINEIIKQFNNNYTKAITVRKRIIKKQKRKKRREKGMKRYRDKREEEAKTKRRRRELEANRYREMSDRGEEPFRSKVRPVERLIRSIKKEHQLKRKDIES